MRRRISGLLLKVKFMCIYSKLKMSCLFPPLILYILSPSAVLIDLDRAKNVSRKASSLPWYKRGVMYSVSNEWTASMIDFWQLGVLIYVVSLDLDDRPQDYHKVPIPANLSDKFVDGLLHGNYNNHNLIMVGYSFGCCRQVLSRNIG